MSVSLYDLLDVDRTASPEEIRAAWKTAIGDLDPTDRRFRAYNQAGEVLLDPARRAAYDAELAADEEVAAEREQPDEPDEPEPGRLEKQSSAAGAQTLASPEPGTVVALGTGRRPVPAWLLLLLVLAAAALIAVSARLWYSQPSDAAIEDAVSQAEATAGRAATTIFSYDHTRLEADREAAVAFMTDDYRQQYEDLFAVIEENAPRTETKVEAVFLASGVVRTSEGREADDRVQVLVTFDQETTNKSIEEPATSPQYAVLTMEKIGENWLVGDVQGPRVPRE